MDIYRIHDICPTCHGYRLKRESSAVKIQNYTIDDIVNLDIENCIKVFEKIENNLLQTKVNNKNWETLNWEYLTS